MLEKNLRLFLSKTAQLNTIFCRTLNCTVTGDPIAKAYAREMMVVRLQDHWARFVRELIVLSASGRAYTASGLSIPSTMGFTGVNDVRTWLVAQRPNRNRELDWHVSQIATNWSQRLGINNQRTVIAALGSTNSPEQQVRVYRNFIVHRTQETANRLQVENFRHNRTPPKLSATPELWTSGGIFLFTRWIRDFQLVARVAST